MVPMRSMRLSPGRRNGHRVDQIPCRQPHGVPLPRPEVPCGIEQTTVSDSPSNLGLVRTCLPPTHLRFFPLEPVRNVARIGHGAEQHASWLRDCDLENEIARAAFAPRKPHDARIAGLEYLPGAVGRPRKPETQKHRQLPIELRPSGK